MMLKILLKLELVYKVLATIIKYKIRFKNIGKLSVIKKIRLLVNPGEIVIGDRVIVEENAILMCIRQYMMVSFHGRIVIGDRCYINHSVNITCTSLLTIEDDVTIAYNVSIFDNIHGTDPLVGNYNRQSLMARDSIVVGQGSWIGANCFIMSSIGKGCIIGANSVVTKPIPDYCIAAGNPARIIKKYDFETKEWIKV